MAERSRGGVFIGVSYFRWSKKKNLKWEQVNMKLCKEPNIRYEHFLHLYEIVEGLYFYFSLTVCACACLSVNKIPAKRMDRYGCSFCQIVAYRTGLDPIEYWWPWVKSQGQSDVISIFFIILCLLPYFVSQLSYDWSKWNLVCRLDMPLVELCLNFIKKIKWMMTSWSRISHRLEQLL